METTGFIIKIVRPKTIIKRKSATQTTIVASSIGLIKTIKKPTKQIILREFTKRENCVATTVNSLILTSKEEKYIVRANY